MNTDKPSWWNEEHASTWDRARGALSRDWQQTKHDLHLGGHELNQSLEHTVSQATGSEVAPPIDAANPPKVIGRWEDVEPAIGFGYAARAHYGDRFPKWSSELERAARRLAPCHDVLERGQGVRAARIRASSLRRGASRQAEE